MVMYDNEIKTKEDKNKTKDKIEPQHSQTQLDDIAHEQTISWRELFVSHMVGSRPIRGRKILHWMMNIIMYH